mmetsp:Transcript_9191/g.18063  ORF Transcript_9191/g.18063 Transcript_9191/m.18063 type:complete len:95 (+) Transcript_9191:166-450(+)
MSFREHDRFANTWDRSCARRWMDLSRLEFARRLAQQRCVSPRSSGWVRSREQVCGRQFERRTGQQLGREEAASKQSKLELKLKLTSQRELNKSK